VDQNESVLRLLGRGQSLFQADIARYGRQLENLVENHRFLVIGGAGSIGKAVTRELFKRDPSCLHVVDISENNLVELVRDLRSSIGYTKGDFATFAIDFGSHEFDALLRSGNGYDYVLNLSALKHVRSEKDPFTLMRMVYVNILYTVASVQKARDFGATRYFSVSTDKAANPVNMMGASKRIMEMFLMRESESLPVSTARFANVAFSDGSLLYGFNRRFERRQPIAAPSDVRRYFITPQESGELCLFSCLLGENRDIFFPKLSEQMTLTKFSDIAVRYLAERGFEAYACDSEEEARVRADELIAQGKWPCVFFPSDTTGEKGFEQFYTGDETLDLERFSGIGVIKNPAGYNAEALQHFSRRIEEIHQQETWQKTEIVALFKEMIPEFEHLETGRYLDQKM
jgi:FlaA1/EpsC-like NDP-sugar epimerase